MINKNICLEENVKNEITYLTRKKKSCLLIYD